MKNIVTQSLRQLLDNRRLLVVFVVLVVTAIATTSYIAMTLEASDLRIITHYSAFGATHFYRDSWVYLLTFIGFIVVTVIASIAMGVKLMRQDRTPLALLLAWIGVAMLVITAMTYIHLTGLL